MASENSPPLSAGADGAAPQVVIVVGVGVSPSNSAYIEAKSLVIVLAKMGWVIVN